MEFVDTIVHLYAYDLSVGDRHDAARVLVIRLARGGVGPGTR